MRDVQTLRAAIDRIERRGRGRRFPTPLKTAVARYVVAARAKGAKAAALEAELSISWETLRRWASTLSGPALATVECRPGPTLAADVGPAERVAGRGVEPRANSPARGAMITLSRSVRVWAYPAPCDMRKGYNGLFGLVANELKHDPLGGDLFLFTNRRRTSCKVLSWDSTGLCIFAKRLERGQFAKLWPAETAVRLTACELALFIEGCALVGRQKLSPDAIVIKPVAA